MEANLPAMIADCREAEAAQREQANDSSIDFGCEQIGEVPVPTMEDMGISLPIADRITAELVPYATFAYAFLVLLLMGGFVAAEFSTGALGNWLTFKPQRVRVALSKLAAAGVGGALAASVGLGLLVLGARMVATINRPDSTCGSRRHHRWRTPSPSCCSARSSSSSLPGLLGAALALLLRHTARARRPAARLPRRRRVHRGPGVPRRSAHPVGRHAQRQGLPQQGPRVHGRDVHHRRREPVVHSSACRKSATRTAGSTCSCSCSASRRQQSSSSDVATSPDLPLQPPHAIQPYARWGSFPGQPPEGGWPGSQPSGIRTGFWTGPSAA